MSFLSIILIDYFINRFVVKMGKNYYPKVFLEECKYIFKEKNINTFINDDLQETLMNLMTQIILMILMLRKSIPLFFWIFDC